MIRNIGSEAWIPNVDSAVAAESAKKLKYLKNPRIEKLTIKAPVAKDYPTQEKEEDRSVEKHSALPKLPDARLSANTHNEIKAFKGQG